MKQQKESLIIVFLLFLALLPNILSYFYVKSINWPFLLALSLMLISLPAVIFKKKTWLWIVFCFVVLSPFEIITILTTNSRINNVIIASIFSTSKSEASELLIGLIPLLIGCIVLVGTYLFALRKIKSNTYLRKSFRVGILIFSMLLFSLQLLNTKSQEKDFYPKLKQTLINLKTDLSYYVFPTNLIYNTAIFKKEVMNEKIALKNLEHFTFNAKKTDENPQIIVFIIGESSRAVNWSLFGYEVKTNPNLENQDGLFLLTDTYAASNSTYRSIPMLLTKSTPQDQDEWKHSGTLVRAFKESGYYTAWIGGQSKGHNVVKLAEKKSDFVDLELGPDGNLFEMAKKVIKNTKQSVFVVIHTNGSHYDYKNRYPKEFEVFTPSGFINADLNNKTEIINAYNNSILYTDYLIDDLIQFLNSDNRSSAIYYTSDHGENLLDDERKLMFHVQNLPTKYELHVPTFIWLSDTFQNNYQDKVIGLKQNTYKKMSTTITFHSIIDLGNITYPTEDKKQSVFSPSFEEFEKRFIITNLKEVIEID